MEPIGAGQYLDMGAGAMAPHGCGWLWLRLRLWPQRLLPSWGFGLRRADKDKSPGRVRFVY